MSDQQHLQASLQHAIDLISGKILSMAGQCELALLDSKRALLERDGQRAYSVILRDQKIDELEKEIDRLCLEFLVRQQPAGEHLRFVYAAIKINAELERIGDYAESIARQSLTVGSLDPSVDFGDFEKIADVAIPMVKQAAQAFIKHDEGLAWETIEQEEVANDLRDQINAELHRLHKSNQIQFELLTPLMTIARRFERVSDQCKNICEEALYVCTGKYMKHMGSEVFRVLFVDEDDSSLSQMAQGIADSLDLSEFVFSSAGVEPNVVDSSTVSFLKEKGVDISNHISKSLEMIPNFEHYHVIVALSKKARTVFPSAPTKTVGIEWQVEDPSKVQPPDKEAYEKAYKYLSININNLTQAILGENPN
jgi:phosphate transport system protein